MSSTHTAPSQSAKSPMVHNHGAAATQLIRIPAQLLACAM